MTQHERALAGRLFDAHSEELMALKHKPHVSCLKYNQLQEDDPERDTLIRKIVGKMGERSYFQGPDSDKLFSL